MSYLTIPPPAKLAISTEEVWTSGAATVLLTANGVLLYAFEVPVPMTFSGGQWAMGATATGTTDIAIYTFAGARQANTGAVANVANTAMSANFAGGTITLPAGQYFMALCPSNGTDTYDGKAPPTGKLVTFSRFRLATTAGTAGVTPSSTGGYGLIGSDNTAGFALTVVGGLV